MVSQAHDLFAASLLENILYGTVEKRDDFFEGSDPAEVRAQIKVNPSFPSTLLSGNSLVLDFLLLVGHPRERHELVQDPSPIMTLW